MNEYRFWTNKRKIESALISPFILAGRLLARLRPLDREYRIFFFFPFYHTGGAEKVHLQIVQATGDEDCIVFFTRKSQANTFRNAFEKTNCRIFDISRFTDNKWLYFLNFIYRGILSGYINRQKNRPIVFQGHSNIAYKTAPWIRKEIRQIDLVHSLNTFSRIRIPFLHCYEVTVLISRLRLKDHRSLYAQMGVPNRFVKRMCYIGNAVGVPVSRAGFSTRQSLTVLFSGRNSPEKRLSLFLRIADAVQKSGLPVHFRAMGIDDNEVSAKARVEYLGNIVDPDKLFETYRSSDVLLLTSTTEGMPLAVIEAMGSGCAILATPVGDLPDHIRNGQEGFLFSSVQDEERIIEEAVKWIHQLHDDRELLSRIALQNQDYYKAHFSMPTFIEAYRSLLSTEKKVS